MAKQAATAKTKAVAKLATVGGVPAHLQDKKMTGAGVSTDQSDLLIPMARILQKNSPEVEKKAPTYVKGAEPGDIYIKILDKPIIKGDDGFLFQPCYFSKGFVEWLPRNKGGGGGGGFVTLHAVEPSDTESRPAPDNPERMLRVRKSNGNLIVETRYHGGYIITDEGEPIPAVIPFASSGHTVSKIWMMLMNRKMIGDNKADSFAVYYRFKSVLKTKGPNTWHMFEITDAGEPGDDNLPTTYWAPTEEDYERGRMLYQNLATGAKTFRAEDAAPDDEPATDRANARM